MSNKMLEICVRCENALWNRARKTADRFHRDDCGAGIAEYAVVVGLAVVFGIFILKAFWVQIESFFEQIGTLIMDILGMKS